MNEVRAKKALGQHFLVDLNIARKICDALSGGGIRCVVYVSDRISGRSPEDSGEVSRAVSGRVAREVPGSVSGDISGDVSELRGGERRMGCEGLGGEKGSVLPDAAPAPERAPDAGAACAPDAAPAPCDVLEVGCGMGVLTQFLLRRTDIVTYGAEIDSESVEYLNAHFPEFAPRLIAGDFLGMDLRARFPRGVRIIGNFPYNISSQIFFKILENRDLVPECVGMIQKEVAVRLAEPPGTKEYGILSVLLQAWYDIDYLFTVSETVFNPPPKVKSAVIRLRRNGVAHLDCDEALFVRVVKAAFGQRRKMIRNALRAVFGDFGGAEHPFFTQRAEQLSVADFVQLTNWVAENRC